MAFAVIAGTSVTNIGDTTIVGDIGISPGTALTGGASITHLGSLALGDAVALAALGDATLAAVGLAARAVTTDLTGSDLGTLGTLTPGVYRFASSAQLTGTLTLDFTGQPGGDFVFQIGSTLMTASGAAVVVIGGRGSDGIFWNVGSAATLGTDSALVGNVIARTAITLAHGARIDHGRALALGGAVTLDSNLVSNDPGATGAVPEPSSWALLLVGCGATGAAMRQRRRSQGTTS